MNNRENFDMDIAPDQDRRNDRNRGSKNKNTILVIFVAILLMVIAILVYFVFLQPMSSDNKNTIVVEKTNSAKQTVSESVENLEPTSNSEIVYSKETVTSTPVKPVVSPVKSSTVAKDLSDAKNDKLLEGAIQFQDHVVMEGETLNSIASLYGLNVQTIISVNSIKNIAGVTAGTVLSLPDRNGKYYTVKKGDMLSTIASDYSSTLGWKTLQELNGLSDTKLDVGDKIFIPDMSEVALKPTMSKAVTQFIQPIESKIIVHYGQGIKNNPYDDDSILGGILLSGAGDVLASADGKVLDVGMDNDINFVLITHKESYETVYKNIDNLKVEIGDEVTAGEKIGEVGNEAGDELPVLYFAIKQSGIPLDPESFF